jgi:hypothetical protein
MSTASKTNGERTLGNQMTPHVESRTQHSRAGGSAVYGKRFDLEFDAAKRSPSRGTPESTQKKLRFIKQNPLLSGASFNDRRLQAAQEEKAAAEE